MQSVDVGGQNIINSEIEILTSLDVAKSVVAKVGPEKILAKKGGGSDPLAAAGVVCSGIEVAPPRGSILMVSFKHPDAGIVQPVLSAVIHSYMLKHLEVHGGGGEMEDYLTKQKDDLRKKLGQTEDGTQAAENRGQSAVSGRHQARFPKPDRQSCRTSCWTRSGNWQSARRCWAI